MKLDKIERKSRFSGSKQALGDRPIICAPTTPVPLLNKMASMISMPSRFDRQDMENDQSCIATQGLSTQVKDNTYFDIISLVKNIETQEEIKEDTQKLENSSCKRLLLSYFRLF